MLKRRFAVLSLAIGMTAACADGAGDLDAAPEQISPRTSGANFGPVITPGGEETPRDEETFDHDHAHGVVLPDAVAVAEAFADGAARFEQPDPFQQVGLMFDADRAEGLVYRMRLDDARWTGWRDVEVTWSEGRLHVARILLEQPTDGIELRGGEGIDFVNLEFFEAIEARAGVLARDLPFDTGDGGELRDLEGDLRAAQQAVAPRSLVIPRAEWGARNPDKICGSIVAPYRMSVHHTYQPSGDGGDAAARMRQMQAYHIDNRGWCDIGYHFVVAQSGKIYQGRSDERRPGAHVGNQNAGNIGVSYIADFTSQTPTDTQLNAGAAILGWASRTYGITLNRTNVKGHREWPGQSTSCPGNNMINKLDELLRRASDGGTSGGSHDVTIDVRFLGMDNFYKQGSSEKLPDVFPGDTFQAEILIHNKSSQVIRGVKAGFWIEEPFLEATNYTIYTDHPAYDRSTWQINDANDAAGNPPHDNMGKEGILTMHAFSPNETKRILIDLKATRYSIGFVDHPDVRGWVQNIDDIYGPQNKFADDPATNQVGRNLRAHAQMDVLSRAEWQFNAKDADDLEGWTGAGNDHYDQLKLNTTHGLLALHVTGSDARVVSPTWTRIDADAFDQLVLRARSHDGKHVKAVYWSRDGENFSEDRVVRFEAEGDSEYHDLVIPIGQHEKWSGTVTRLRIDPLEKAEPAEGDSGWYDIDKIYFQASGGETTTSATDGHVGVTPTTLLELTDGGEPEVPIDDRDEDGVPDNDGETPMSDGPHDSIAVKEGCSATGSHGSVPGGAALLGLLAAMGLGLRRRLL